MMRGDEVRNDDVDAGEQEHDWTNHVKKGRVWWGGGSVKGEKGKGRMKTKKGAHIPLKSWA